MRRAATIALFALLSGCGPSGEKPPATAQESPVSAERYIEAPPTKNTYYVKVEATDELSAPGGGRVVNQIYRGQRLEITDRRNGYARVNSLDALEAAWVKASSLSRDKPAQPDQPSLTPAQSDTRINIGNAGEMGLKASDVVALREAGAALIANGTCSSITDGDASFDHPNLFYVNCEGELFNRFFRLKAGKPAFCGQNPDGC
ncbi:MAG TPA: hypothetical protein VG735_13740 [Caulobacterales bacterium]|nr:hypothetical protein [Caulobacterales bacterium]